MTKKNLAGVHTEAQKPATGVCGINKKMKQPFHFLIAIWTDPRSWFSYASKMHLNTSISTQLIYSLLFNGTKQMPESTTKEKAQELIVVLTLS